MHALRIVVYGPATYDILLAPETKWTLTSRGLIVTLSDGTTLFIPTDSVPAESRKVNTPRSLGPFLQQTPAVAGIRLGGGGLRVAEALAGTDAAVPPRVYLLNEMQDGVLLARFCIDRGIHPLSLGLFRTPASLIVPMQTDRLIVKEELRRLGESLSRERLERIAGVLRECRVLVCVSAKDGAIASMVFERSRAARKYFQPTGSLGANRTLEIACQATDLCCNFGELRTLALQAGLDAPEVSETDANAPAHAASLLRRLQAMGLAGSLSATVTLGRCGVVAADWPAGRIDFIGFVPRDSRAMVPTQAGTGDLFLGALVAFGNESPSRHAPASLCARRAMTHVAGKLGLLPGSYHLDATEL